MRICRCLVTDPSDRSRTFHGGGRAAKASGEERGSSASSSEPDQAAGVESGCQLGQEGPPAVFALFVVVEEDFLGSDVDDGDGGAAAAATGEEEARPRGRLQPRKDRTAGEEEVEVEVGDVDDENGACDSSPSAGAARKGRLLVLLRDRDGDAAEVAPRQQREQVRPPCGGEGRAI